MHKPASSRPRNAVATRQSILTSSREVFARLGYDGAGVREIAAGAGVTAMLVNRYFGSKEQLFAEALAESMATTTVVLPKILESSACGADIATALLSITKAGATPLEGFQIMLRSASSERAADIARPLIERYHLAAIANALAGELAPQRAAMILSVIAGFQMMRQMIGLTAFTDATSESLIKVLGPLFQQLIDDADKIPRSAAKKRQEPSA